jgi:hypothetical protein
MSAPVRLTLTLAPDRYAVCRLGPQADVPHWATRGPFFSVTHTADELSVVCPEKNVPAGVQQADGWRLVKFEGPFEFSATGILAAAADPLAVAGVSIVAISTYDTDYILVRQAQIDRALEILAGAGHEIRR